jgi:hypothetical protein
MRWRGEPHARGPSSAVLALGCWRVGCAPSAAVRRASQWTTQGQRAEFIPLGASIQVGAVRGAVQRACEACAWAAVLHTTGHAAETVGGASDALHMVKVCLAYSVLHTTPLRHGATHAVTPIMKQGAGGRVLVRC